MAEGRILHASSYVRSLEESNSEGKQDSGCRAGGGGTGARAGEDAKALEMEGGDGHAATRTYFLPQTRAPENDQNGKFHAYFITTKVVFFF